MRDYTRTPDSDGAGQSVQVTDLLDGSSLAALLERGALEQTEALAVCGQVAEALDAAHRAGIVHGDLVPENVLLTTAGVKVLGFGAGSALVHGAHGLAPGSSVCTAPEQLVGGEAVAASDVYALGCVLHWCLTGRPPYPDPDMTFVSHAHLHAAPPPLGVAGLPPEIDELRLSCLAKEPSQRPTAGEALAVLGRFVSWTTEAPGESETTELLPVLGTALREQDADTPPSAARHAGRRATLDRRRLLPVGLVLAALGVIVLLIVGLGNAMTGGAPATSASGGSAANTASSTPTVGTVVLPDAAASPLPSASQRPSPTPTPNASSAAVSIPGLPNSTGNPVAYLRAMSVQIRALMAQGSSTLQQRAGNDLLNAVGNLENTIASAQQNGGRKQWRGVSNSISGLEQQISDDASAGRISSSAARLLTGELRQLAAGLPTNGN
ncbi:MAG: protein kinase domain-containing protein [Actinocrinis sp.]